jgi:hypothetical protein
MPTVKITRGELMPRRGPTVADMRAHVDRLAARLGASISIMETRRRSAWTWESGDGLYVIGIHPIRSRSTYYIALHELGHVSNKKSTFVHGAMIEEVAAWEWAMQQAIVEPSLRAREAIHRGLRSYLLELFPRPEPPTREALAVWKARLQSGAVDRVPAYYQDWYTRTWEMLTLGQSVETFGGGR